MLRRTKSCLLLLLFFFSISKTFAWEQLSNELDIQCKQHAFSRIDCVYRLLGDNAIQSISASLSKQELIVDRQNGVQAETGLTAILFLVDTSDPARHLALSKIIEHIEQLLEVSEAHHLIGLASFDKDLQLRAAVGASKAQILSSSAKLQAKGLTTELYRNILKSIDILKKVQADRKAIFVFSDGQAEDKAYFHQDVVRAARQSGIIINSIGYPRSVALSVALQTIRRLSDDTGGLYFETGQDFILPSPVLDTIYANIDKGEKIQIDLSDVDYARVSRAEVDLLFDTELGKFELSMPISIPLIRPIAPVAASKPVKQAPPAPAQAKQPTTTQNEVALRGMDLWLWYGVPIALIVLIVLTLLTLFLLYKKPATKPEKESSRQDEFRPYAYLIAQDEQLRYPVTRTIWRIGRSRDNEMTLNDSSISRRHAEIQRDNKGNFILLDTNSSNGVFVNNEKVTVHQLKEGDMIEIGDVCLRFTQRPIDYQANEQTAMLSTKMPA